MKNHFWMLRLCLVNLCLLAGAMSIHAQSGPAYSLMSRWRVGQALRYEYKFHINWQNRIREINVMVQFQSKEKLVARQDDGSITVECTVSKVSAAVRDMYWAVSANPEGVLEQQKILNNADGITFTLQVDPTGKITDISSEETGMYSLYIKGAFRSLMGRWYSPVSAEKHRVGDTWQHPYEDRFTDPSSLAESDTQIKQTFELKKVKQITAFQMGAEMHEQSVTTADFLLYFDFKGVPRIALLTATGQGKSIRQIDINTGLLHQFKGEMELEATHEMIHNDLPGSRTLESNVDVGRLTSKLAISTERNMVQ